MNSNNTNLFVDLPILIYIYIYIYVYISMFGWRHQIVFFSRSSREDVQVLKLFFLCLGQGDGESALY